MLQCCCSGVVFDANVWPQHVGVGGASLASATNDAKDMDVDGKAPPKKFHVGQQGVGFRRDDMEVSTAW
jgi:hypothetical protein